MATCRGQSGPSKRSGASARRPSHFRVARARALARAIPKKNATNPHLFRPHHHHPGYDYGDVLGLSLLFYEAQRSGKLPPTNRISWRNDSNLGDKAPNGADAAGGMHDAGDHLKINFPGAWSAGQLAWAAIEFKKGFALAGQTQHVKDVLRHVADYYVKCHFSDFGYIAMV